MIARACFLISAAAILFAPIHSTSTVVAKSEKACRGGPLWPPLSTMSKISGISQLPVWGDHRGSPLHESIVNRLCNHSVSISLQAAAQTAPQRATVYVCPMHPEVKSKAPGKCPQCGMTLEAESTADHKPSANRTKADEPTA